DLSFLAGETGFDKQAVARFALAARLAELGLRAEFWFALVGLAALGYSENESVEENLNRIENALSSLDEVTVRKALALSLALYEIDDRFESQIPRWVAAFLRLLAERAADA